MQYTVTMIPSVQSPDASIGLSKDRLSGVFPSVAAANEAGAAEIARRAAAPGTLTFDVHDETGAKVDEAELGLS